MISYHLSVPRVTVSSLSIRYSIRALILRRVATFSFHCELNLLLGQIYYCYLLLRQIFNNLLISCSVFLFKQVLFEHRFIAVFKKTSRAILFSFDVRHPCGLAHIDLEMNYSEALILFNFNR